jgi:hypothetical protein
MEKIPTGMDTIFIPRAHLSTVGLSAQINPMRDEELTDTDRFRSRSLSGFYLSDELDQQRILASSRVPSNQSGHMLNSLKSLPMTTSDAYPFADVQDIDEIDWITDMVEDMIQHDDHKDDLLEPVHSSLNLTTESNSNGKGSLQSIC